MVFLHWGTEGETCPHGTPDQASPTSSSPPGPTSWWAATPTACRAAGADGEAFVAYGLGNFVFYSPDGSPGAATGVLTVTATGRTIDELRVGAGHHPVGGARDLLEGADAEAATGLQAWDGTPRSCAWAGTA